MSYQRPQYSNGGMRPQPWDGRVGHQLLNDYQRELQRLGSLLEMERARWFEENQKVAYVQRELDNARAELKRQERLKEMTRQPTAEEVSNSEFLSRAAITSQVQNGIKHKRKMQLQQDFEQLKAAHIASKEATQAEKEKSDALQQQLDQMKSRYEELQAKCEAAFEGNLQVDMQLFYEERIRQEQHISQNLRAEKNELQEKLSKEIACLQETERCLQSQLELSEISYQELNKRHEAEVSALRQKAEHCQYEVNCAKELNLERAKHDHHLINTLRLEKNSLNQSASQEFALLRQQSTEAIQHLQSELEHARVSYQELRATYERDVSAMRQKAELFEQALDKEKEAHSQNMKSNLDKINELGAEMENMKTALKDREEPGPPRRKAARRLEQNKEKETVPAKTSSDNESLSDKRESADPEAVEAASVRKLMRQTLTLKKQQKTNRRKRMSKTCN
ncbi:trichohyalin-like [Poecilia reticulata]|uniref:trichohyalin-like n=1 Tax=Poecilia reticulata TaxID=8081 RepID=UPI0004A35A97|nr:PREDICTED: trichohyalin-like [Poecilia reticulata]